MNNYWPVFVFFMFYLTAFYVLYCIYSLISISCGNGKKYFLRLGSVSYVLTKVGFLRFYLNLTPTPKNQFNWKITNHKNHCYVNKLNWKYFRPIVDIDLPELPDFLRPDPSTTGRPLTPIQDIDLPDGFEVVMEGNHELTEQEISKQEETSGNTFKYKVCRQVFLALVR
jgi:hypothetical protein